MPMLNNTKPIWQTIGLGALAGIRASAAPAIAGHYYHDGVSPILPYPVFKFVQAPVTTVAVKVLKVAERNHNQSPGLNKIAMHVAAGAFAGAAVFRKNRQSMLNGMLIGGFAALVTSVASRYMQNHADKFPEFTTPLKDAFGEAFKAGSGVALFKG
ncbi:DUF4126 family protein [Mucilaginibacter sp. MD40]|uniref:DUF4126 family protein n=2 Tax=unclassified Mucilaginibacter TaxID=2617802 RepID=UPI00117D18AF|nr:DUF4126 family protein [Mucilaginibacter sp. MD40]